MSDTRLFPEFEDNDKWALVARQSLTASPGQPRGYIPLEPRSFAIQDSSVVLVGVRSADAEAYYYLGCKAEQVLGFTPSGATGFDGIVQPATTKSCRLNTLTLCAFPKMADSWTLRLNFPWWLQTVSFEVWRYLGIDSDLFGPERVLVQQFAQSVAIQELLSPNRARKGAVVRNNSAALLTLDFDDPANLQDDPISVAPNDYIEIPANFTGLVVGVWAEAGSGHALIREFL
jgi:hypothetical protein